MTDTSEQRQQRLINFRGRDMAVRFPTDAQLFVWQRTITELQQADTESWDGEEAMRANMRAGRIIDSVIVDRADRQWLDDLTLDEGLNLADRAEIITLTVAAFTEATDNPTPTKRAPAKRARRKVS